jgi:hypothetical protein
MSRHGAVRHPQSMKMHSRSIYDRLRLRWTKANNPWSRKPDNESGLDIAPHPKLSPGLGQSAQGRLFPLSMSSGAAREESIMDEIYRCCAGLDVHKQSVEGCVRRIDSNDRVQSQTRHWGTMTRDLQALAD